MKTIAIVLLTGFVFLTGCKKNVVSPNCTEKGKLESVSGYNLITHPFIRTSEGKLLFVCKSAVSFQWNAAYTGMPVNFSYEIIPDTSTDCALVQHALLPVLSYTPVKLTCISVIDK